MMEEKLMQDFPSDAQVIMAEIVGGGLLINGGMDIDYNNCNRYQEVEKKSGKGVVGECEYIAGLRAEAETNKERLKEALVKASLGPIRGIYTREVAMQVVRGELVDPIMGESLRNGKITFKGGLLVEGISKGVEYFKDNQIKEKRKNIEKSDYEERMRKHAEALAKKEQGQYEYVGEPANILPNDIRNGKKSDKENFKEIVVKNKGDSVWSILGNKPTQKQLEEFIKQNPYIAARGVGRDQNGNIINLTIRVGETILVPENIAAAYKAGYTPAINRIKDSSGDVQDVCFDPNSGDKYANIFGVQDAAYKGIINIYVGM
jgi:hypothetical protein